MGAEAEGCAEQFSVFIVLGMYNFGKTAKLTLMALVLLQTSKDFSSHLMVRIFASDAHIGPVKVTRKWTFLNLKWIFFEFSNSVHVRAWKLKTRAFVEVDCLFQMIYSISFCL